ncbi:GNAT family N-acetyltransferase [Gottfriedia luciferensis]|uniref:GNAT family N-acetyltransferase n=1 Tax=Gottfriedia luciferensis TaxID=178774 RepID=UPI000B42D76A|nr:GNAT family N-acetyltransferase [Gottfriedia luciferensis]
MSKINESKILIEPWVETDLNLLLSLNTSFVMKYLGGLESYKQIMFRHKHYLDMSRIGTGQMYTIILLPCRTKIGTVGYWDRVWNNKNVYEIGWSILPQFQRKGIATIAVNKAIKKAKNESKHKYIHAFPSVRNIASNKICEKLNFKLNGKCNFEYPIGKFMECHDWRLKIKKNKSS